MKTVGIVGGIGPESTVDYYKTLIRAALEKSGGHYPRIIINSVDMTEMMSLLSAGNLGGLVRFLSEAVGALSRAGADFGIIASNTPHIVFDEVRRASPIPLISIVEETTRRAEELGMKRVGLLGTAFTMKNDFYGKALAARGIAVVVPGPEDQVRLHEKIMGELEHGMVIPETKALFMDIVKGMKARDGIEGLILGCTELPLILKDRDLPGLPFLNTVTIHIEGILRYMF